MTTPKPSSKNPTTTPTTTTTTTIWSTKLKSKCAILTLNASRESLQTISKWMIFHRKHSKSFVSSLLHLILTEKKLVERKMLYMTILHEVLLSHSALEQQEGGCGGGEGFGTSELKWEKMTEFRNAIGDVVTDVMEHLGECFAKEKEEKKDQMVQKIKSMMDSWEKVNAFGGPSIVEGGRRALERGLQSVQQQQEEQEMANVVVEKEDAMEVAGKAEEKKDTTAAAATTPPSKDDAPKSPTEEETNTEKKDDKPKQETIAPTATDSDEKASETEVTETIKEESKEEKKTEEERTSTSSKQEAEEEEQEFDFDAEGIPYAKVETKEFQKPCKSIASIQITRDFLNDATLNLSTLLSKLPPDLEQICNTYKEDEHNNKPLPEFDNDILDLNIEESMNNVKQYRDIVLQQKVARHTCFALLVKSQCQFGSQTSAKTYYEMKELLDKLQRRKVLVEDAMELEGFDMDGIGKEDDGGGEKESVLEWFDGGGEKEEGGRCVKRIKTG
uniref:CID domain-containing protein n=1 Tax=Ditylum brightwellii TaxID=49249 RepID=A0A7S1Z323_9STRA|mmetsp:Transcript_22955/g.34233  ORF Transcript_22955/g.34233 Transcript_22955/m.34233 type:complete len:501 (+) Transcript_22955:102-1604(+)